MKVLQSDIRMDAAHASFAQTQVKESLNFWVNGAPAGGSAAVANPAMAVQVRVQADVVSFSASAQSLSKTSNVSKEKDDMSPKDSMHIRLLEIMMERLTGKKFKFKLAKLSDFTELPKSATAATPQSVPQSAAPAAQGSPQTSSQGGEGGAAQPSQQQGWGMEYEYQSRRVESEQTSFRAEGVVKTADGKEISFNVDLSMSREFVEEQNISIQAGDTRVKDPLVINFDGAAAELSNTTFSFDIDSDGTEDQVATLLPGSGFLALDKNGDGTVNDGTELFGPASGNGFEELAAYDSDQNQWIDENDSVYQQLKVWTLDGNGGGSGGTLQTLAQAGVGAIYLGNVATPFSIKDDSNELLGQVRSTGITLNEDGSVGTIQQVDLKA